MSERSVSAIEAIRLLRNSIESRLRQNEDYRILSVLDRALAELSQRPLSGVQQLQEQAEVAAQSISATRPATAQASAVAIPAQNPGADTEANLPAPISFPGSHARWQLLLKRARISRH